MTALKRRILKKNVKLLRGEGGGRLMRGRGGYRKGRKVFERLDANVCVPGALGSRGLRGAFQLGNPFIPHVLKTLRGTAE